MCLWRRGRRGPNVRAAGTEDSEKQVRACSGAPSCRGSLADLGWGGMGWRVGVGYIGTRWWAAAQSVAGVRLVRLPVLSPRALGPFTEPAGQSPRRGREDRDRGKETLGVTVRKGRWPWALGGAPLGGRVGVTWEGSPCNGCLGASGVPVAASSTS